MPSVMVLSRYFVDWTFAKVWLCKEWIGLWCWCRYMLIIEPWHEISNNLVCATSKGSDQPAHTRRLIRAFDCCLNIPTDWTLFIASTLKRRLHRLVWIYTCQIPQCWKSCVTAHIVIFCKRKQVSIISRCHDHRPQTQHMAPQGKDTEHRLSHDSKKIIKIN